MLAHHEYIKSIPAIQKYLASPKRHPEIWVVDWLAAKRKDMDIDMILRMAPGIVKGM